MSGGTTNPLRQFQSWEGAGGGQRGGRGVFLRCRTASLNEEKEGAKRIGGGGEAHP